MSDTIPPDQRHGALEAALAEAKRAVFEAHRDGPPEVVADHELVRADGDAVSLSELFGGREDLIVVHNMGRDCPYCTLWADGFDGLLPHIEDRAAFAVCSPDPPPVQREFAASRSWDFTMVSGHDSSFTEAMGFVEGDTHRPGVSTFHLAGDGTITRVASRRFGPFDDYNPVWNLFGLLRDGVDGWEPRYEY